MADKLSNINEYLHSDSALIVQKTNQLLKKIKMKPKTGFFTKQTLRIGTQGNSLCELDTDGFQDDFIPQQHKYKYYVQYLQYNNSYYALNKQKKSYK